MVSRPFYFFTSYKRVVLELPLAALASRNLRFTGIYSPRNRLIEQLLDCMKSSMGFGSNADVQQGQGAHLHVPWGRQC